MVKKNCLHLVLLAATAIILSSCLTTGGRVDMQEFKKQLEDGGQALTEDEKEQAVAVAEAASQQAAESAKAPTEAPMSALEEEHEEPAVKEAATAPAEIPAAKSGPAEKTEKALPQEAGTQPAATAVKTAVRMAEVLQDTAKVTAGQSGGYKWLLAAVFAAAFLIFAVIAFALSVRKKKKDTQTVIPAAAPAKVTAESAIKEYSSASKAVEKAPDAAVEKTQQEAAGTEPVAAKEKEEPALPEVDEEEEAAKAGLAMGGAPAVRTAAETRKAGEFGEGSAAVSPVEFAAAGQSNAVHLTYKAGGDSPEYRTIKITVPDGWSNPSTKPGDEGYFSVSVNSGRLISTAAEGRSMLITVYGLAADYGTVSVTYGERRGGGPGARAQDAPGEAVFRFETEAAGSQDLKEIEDSPVVDVN